MTNELIVRRSIEIKAPARRIWEILTDPEHTKKYMFGCEVVSDWNIGSPLIWRGAADGIVYVKGDLLALVKEKIFSFTVFDPNAGIEDVPSNYTTVIIELIPGDGSTTLTVTQGNFTGMADGENRFLSTEAGWDMVLPRIKELAEQ
jgi:uncharacterized protein YndB with AHSA1/START domain